ncbi:sensor histidine kinase [Nucisporomicrobium flavum]|uniref:sensor histidine kinase n=1 Tax=Nucisporomicrobium flavum TaxID=2785915 RepID=UPI0018F6828A|nr:histidine kinase [Nucisporomicrobium flavum]
MAVRLLRPLVAATTYRRGTYLLLGGVVVMPYALVTVGLARVVREGSTPAAVVVPLILTAAAIGLVPPFLHGTRTLEIVAVRGLLGVDLPDPPGRIEREARLRTALWFGVHLAVGAVVGSALFLALPAAAVLVTRPGRLIPLGLILLPATVYAIAGLGALAAVMAPVLLGPSGAERIAALEAETLLLAARNRLARELHDSVGHALTVTVLQAGAAGRLLGRDEAFVRRALTSIEETGRAAMEDLDRVLGVLRDGELTRTHGPGLTDVDQLTSGLPVTLEASGPLHEVPAAVSREAYRLAQEAVTNALRHDPGGPVELRLAVAARRVTLEVGNALRDGGEPGGSRGLTGMRERVTLLGGVLDAGPYGDRWRVRAELPW